MELLLDPGLWISLLTLLVLEVVLGIDNLIFIAILADKLPPHQRDKARIIGLTLALFMRLGLLSVISWLVSLTQPLVSFWGYSFSGRDLILFFGGLFLLYKAVTELHEKIEGGDHAHTTDQPKVFAKFGFVVTQIVLLDIVFSLDSVITAVGMVDNIYVMMTAVVLAVGLMLFASKPLTVFVNKNPAIVILCLSFLLMIGVSLIAEGLGFHIPKGYIYSGIGVAILIEAFNQFAKRNQLKQVAQQPLRQRAAAAIYRLMGDDKASLPDQEKQLSAAFIPEERLMIGGVLSLSERAVSTIMVPRDQISWININDTPDIIRAQILAVPHNLFPVAQDTLDNVFAVVSAKRLINELDEHGDLSQLGQLSHPSFAIETQSIIDCIYQLQQSKGSLLMVKNPQNKVVGLVTPLDVLESIAGEFPDEDE